MHFVCTCSAQPNGSWTYVRKARKKFELLWSGESQFSGYLVASLIFPQCKTDLSFRSVRYLQQGPKNSKLWLVGSLQLRFSSVQVQAEPEKIAATPEEMPASASASSKVPNGPKADPEIKAKLEEIEGILTQKSEAKFGEEEEKVEIEKTKTKESELNPRPTGWKDGSVWFCDFCILLLSYINCKNRMKNFWKLDECQDYIDDIKIKVPEFFGPQKSLSLGWEREIP